VNARHARERASIVSRLLTILVALVLLAAVVLLARTVSSCTIRPVTIAAATDIAAPLREALAAAGDGGALPRCAQVSVVDQEPVNMVAALAGGVPGTPRAWVPDSTVWLARLPAAARAPLRVGSLASTPLVVATTEKAQDPTPRPLAAVLGAATPPQIVDPRQGAAGTLVELAVTAALTGPDGRPSPQLAGAVVALTASIMPSAADGLRAIAARPPGGDAAVIVPAQSVTRLASDAPGRRLGTIPIQGAPSLDFPLISLDGPDPDLDTIATALRAVPARASFDRAGFAAPAGTVAVPAAADVAKILDLWDALRRNSAILAVLDVSGSMASREGGRTRIQLATDAARTALGLFTPSSDVGLWTFSARPAPAQDWDVLSPVRPLGEPVPGWPSRRAALAAAASSIKAVPDGGTALYATTLAAVRSMQANYRLGKENSVAVLTDGRNEADDGIDLPQLLATLRAEADPSRPVAVITIGIGPDADLDALRQISDATQGRAYDARDPQDIKRVFLDALLLRLCRPHC
jgi:Ca-activated chloride channel homolog